MSREVTFARGIRLAVLRLGGVFRVIIGCITRRHSNVLDMFGARASRKMPDVIGSMQRLVKPVRGREKVKGWEDDATDRPSSQTTPRAPAAGRLVRRCR